MGRSLGCPNILGYFSHLIFSLFLNLWMLFKITPLHAKRKLPTKSHDTITVIRRSPRLPRNMKWPQRSTPTGRKTSIKLNQNWPQRRTDDINNDSKMNTNNDSKINPNNNSKTCSNNEPAAPELGVASDLNNKICINSNTLNL